MEQKQIREYEENKNSDNFYIKEFAALKEEESYIKKKVFDAGNFLKKMMKERELETLENDDFILNYSETTGTEILAVDLLKELDVKIHPEAEEMFNLLFKVNITESKKQIGALALNKIMRKGTESQRLNIKKKK